MRAVVAYKAGRALYKYGYPGLRSAKRLRLNSGHYRAAGFAARKFTGWAARRIQRRWRSRKGNFSRSRVQNKIGTSSAKRNEITAGATLGIQNTRTLYSINLLGNISPGNSGNNENRRETSLVNISGFKFCFYIRNNQPNPLIWHFVLIAPKGCTNNVDPTNDTILEQNFFRANDGIVRGTNFGNQLSGMEFMCKNINTDQWIVLKHKRYRLGPNQFQSDSTNTNRDNFRIIEHYYKFKRQVRYDDDVLVGAGLYLVGWADTIDASATSTPVSGGYSLQQRVIKYFREPTR